MSNLKLSATVSKTSANRTGVYLAVLQLVFTLGWTTYVIYLPKLAAQVGIAPSAVILILMMDQAVFTITDTAMGIAADRIAGVVGRLGRMVIGLTAVSCAAFVALPFVAATGPAARTAFIALILVWAVTSSALRAPPLMLLGKYAAKPSIPFLSALVMLGYGLAGAGALSRRGVANQDARLPFVISSAELITTLALSGVERNLAAKPATNQAAEAARPLGWAALTFIASMVVLALGYQLHFSINSGPFSCDLPGRTICSGCCRCSGSGSTLRCFPASTVAKRRGGLVLMGAAGLLGAVAILGAELAGNLDALIAAQFAAGAAWGCMLMSAVSAALSIGDSGAEGKVVGLVFSALALATFARMAAVAGGLQKLPEYAPLLHWAPVACWSVAGAGLLVMAASRAQQVAATRRV